MQVAELARYEPAVMPTMQGDVWPRDPGYDPTKKWDWLVRVIGIRPTWQRRHNDRRQSTVRYGKTRAAPTTHAPATDVT